MVYELFFPIWPFPPRRPVRFKCLWVNSSFDCSFKTTLIFINFRSHSRQTLAQWIATEPNPGLRGTTGDRLSTISDTPSTTMVHPCQPIKPGFYLPREHEMNVPPASSSSHISKPQFTAAGAAPKFRTELLHLPGWTHRAVVKMSQLDHGDPAW